MTPPSRRAGARGSNDLHDGAEAQPEAGEPIHNRGRVSSVGLVLSIKHMINQGVRDPSDNTRRPARLRSSQDQVIPSEKEQPAPANRRESIFAEGLCPKRPLTSLTPGTSYTAFNQNSIHLSRVLCYGLLGVNVEYLG